MFEPPHPDPRRLDEGPISRLARRSGNGNDLFSCGFECVFRHGANPVSPAAPILPDLISLIDCDNRAFRAVHPYRDFLKREIRRAQKVFNSVNFLR